MNKGKLKRERRKGGISFFALRTKSIALPKITKSALLFSLFIYKTRLTISSPSLPSVKAV